MSIKNNNFPLCLLHGGGGKQWSELIHNGPMFAPLYEPHNIPIMINNQKYQLSGLAEEYITMYARYLGTEYTTNPKIANRFNRNFLHDWKKVLPKNINVSNMNDIDVKDIIKELLKYIIIEQPTLITINLIDFIESIIHLKECNMVYYKSYTALSLNKLFAL